MAEHKAGEEGVYAVVSRRFGTLGKPNLSEAEWRNWWADYYDACADLPLASLEAGMRAWVNNPDAEFIPRPGKLRDLAETTQSLTLRRYQRAKRALQVADGQPAPDPEVLRIPDPSQAAAVRASLESYRASFKARAQKNPLASRRLELPNTAGKPDEHGISAEMRKVLARQNAQENEQ